MKGLVWALILRSYLVFKEMGGAMLNYAIALPFFVGFVPRILIIFCQNACIIDGNA